MHHKRSKPLRRHRRNPSALSEGEPSEDVVTTVEPESAHLSALAFKVVQDKRRGPLVVSTVLGYTLDGQAIGSLTITK